VTGTSFVSDLAARTAGGRGATSCRGSRCRSWSFIVYGEAASTPTASKLRGQVFRIYDGAGMQASEQFDVDGNLVRQSRCLAAAYDTTPDWSDLDELDDPKAMDTATAGPDGTKPDIPEKSMTDTHEIRVTEDEAWRIFPPHGRDDEISPPRRKLSDHPRSESMVGRQGNFQGTGGCVL
jgi:hypothetical protein